MTEFSNYSRQVWKHGFYSSHSLIWQGRPYRALSSVFWVILINGRQGWPQMATVFCPDHHSKPRGTDSFSAQRMLGSSCWGQRPNETSPDAESRNSPNTWGSGLTSSLETRGPGIWGQAQLGPHRLLEQIPEGSPGAAVSCPLPHLRSLNLWAWALSPSRVSAEPQTCWGVHKIILLPTSP